MPTQENLAGIVPSEEDILTATITMAQVQRRLQGRAAATGLFAAVLALCHSQWPQTIESLSFLALIVGAGICWSYLNQCRELVTLSGKFGVEKNAGVLAKLSRLRVLVPEVAEYLKTLDDKSRKVTKAEARALLNRYGFRLTQR